MAVNGIITQEQITQLVESDLVNNRRTLELIESQKEREVQAKLELEAVRSAAVSFESALDTLKSADTFYSSTVTSSDTSIVTAEAGANTSLTSYDITNITMAKSAQKVSSSTLGLTDATSAYYESTGSILDSSNLGVTDTFNNHDSWTEIQRNGTITDTVFDGKTTIALTSSAAVRNHAGVSQEVDPTKLSNPYYVQVDTFFDVLGPSATGDYSDDSFRISIDHADFQVDVRFSQQGVYYENSFESFTDLGISVEEDQWTQWTVEVDPTAKTFNILKDGLEVATAIDASTNAASFTEGTIQLRQGSQNQVNLTYVDNFEIYPQDVAGNGFVNENELLDNSESPTNIAGAISNGYFEINDQRINVNTSTDTLMEVLSKINAAETGVTATWDDNADKIRLTVDDGGVQTIDFGADTSGFFAAMNIDTAAPTAAGVESAWDREIADVAALSSVSSGYFNINGITFDVDTSVDSLQDILNDINQSKAGVSVYYEKSLDKVVMTSTETGEKITFGNDTSNFLTTIMGDLNDANYTQGSVDVNGQTIAIDSNEFEIGDVKFKVHAESTEGASVTIARDTEKATLAIEDFVTKYNEMRLMIDEKTLSGQPLSGDRTMRNIENNLRHFILNPIENTGSYDFLRDIGVEYKRGRLSVNKTALGDALRTDPDSVGTIFGFDSNGDGLRDDGGLSNVMKFEFLNDITSKYSGDIGRKNKLIEARISKLNTDYKKYQKVIANKSERLYAEYNRFAEAVNQMAAQFSTFQAQMAQLNQLTSSLYSNTSSGMSGF